ncbi:MAG: hypothetical protein GY859_13940 [Desulfobacterales bacterium]|nr:hypothetical protein [Desulfobacterales bacterium]
MFSPRLSKDGRRVAIFSFRARIEKNQPRVRFLI